MTVPDTGEWMKISIYSRTFTLTVPLCLFARLALFLLRNLWQLSQHSLCRYRRGCTDH